MTASCDLYDTKDGIAGHLGSLKGMHLLIAARVAAGYQRKERLGNFVLFGHWTLDSCGNIGRMTASSLSVLPKERFPDIPDVLTDTEFWAYVGTHADEGEEISTTSTTMGIAVIAPWEVPCVACGRHWAIEDAFDVTCETSDRLEVLTDWIGRPFADFKSHLEELHDGHYRVSGEMQIRNDRFIDLSPHPTLGGRHVVNHDGWVGRDGEIGPDYIVQEGDETFVSRVHFYHGQCHASMMASRRQAEFGMMFRLAGYKRFDLDATKNCYGEAEFGGPWFEVTTAVGKIVIGWRRRVISIDWSATGQDLLSLFDDVDETKDPMYIHAWRADQAIDYLRRIREALTKEPVTA